MSEISSGGQRLRLPLPVGAFTVNFCKNPCCQNFGREADPYDRRGKKRLPTSNASAYRVSGTESDASINCEACGIKTRIKSNTAIIEEVARHAVKPVRVHRERCSTETCVNFDRSPLTNAGLFYKHGRSAKGRQRFRCRGCGKTTSVGPSTKRQRITHKNALIFRLLVHKVSINGIADITELSASTVYAKIRFIAEQCRRFTADREQRLASLAVERWYLSTDRQDYLVNWHDRGTRKTIQFTSIATACQRTGYILACHPQYDPDVDLTAISSELEADAALKPAMRRHARIWTQMDYEAAVASSPSKGGSTSREDQDSVEDMTNARQLPAKGAIVHADYMMYGHFAHLRNILGADAIRYRFFLDADAGMDKACISIWHEEIAEGRADVFQVTCAKSMTIDQKERAVAEAQKLVKVAREAYPEESSTRQACARYFKENQLRHLPDLEHLEEAPEGAEDLHDTRAWLIADRAARLANFIDYPFATKSEPGKKVALLTDRGHLDLLHVANLYGIASLHRVDNFFMRVRRRVAGLERGTAYPRRAERKWSLYAYYDPAMVGDMLAIIRCYVNYIQPSGEVRSAYDDGTPTKPIKPKTAAMRIGLAKGAIRIEDVLYFKDGQNV